MIFCLKEARSHFGGRNTKRRGKEIDRERERKRRKGGAGRMSFYLRQIEKRG